MARRHAGRLGRLLVVLATSVAGCALPSGTPATPLPTTGTPTSAGQASDQADATVPPAPVGGRGGMPADWPLDVTLPASWRLAVDAASYDAILDGLDPVRRSAVEAIGPPSAASWVPPYAVEMTSTPLPGGGLTMLMLAKKAGGYPSIDDLETARSTNLPSGYTLVRVERVQGQVGPVVKVTYRMPWNVGHVMADVGMIGYFVIVADDAYGIEFVIPVEQIDSRDEELDAIIATLRLRPAPRMRTPAPRAAPSP